MTRGHQQRTQRIVHAYVSGTPVVEMAAHLGVTRAAIYNLLQRQPNYPDLKAQRRQNRPLNTEQTRKQRRGYIAITGPRVPIPIERLIEEGHAWRTRYGDPVLSNRWKMIADPEFPSVATMVNRFHGWNRFITALGLPVENHSNRGPKSRFTEDECIRYVLEYARHRSQLGNRRGTETFDGLTAWLKTQPNAPSAQTIRLKTNRTWSSLHQQALDTLNAEDQANNP